MHARCWITDKGWTLARALAEVQKVDATITITVAQMSRLVSGKQWPSRAFVRAFAKISRNKVDANSWAGIE